MEIKIREIGKSDIFPDEVFYGAFMPDGTFIPEDHEALVKAVEQNTRFAITYNPVLITVTYCVVECRITDMTTGVMVSRVGECGQDTATVSPAKTAYRDALASAVTALLAIRPACGIKPVKAENMDQGLSDNDRLLIGPYRGMTLPEAIQKPGFQHYLNWVRTTDACYTDPERTRQMMALRYLANTKKGGKHEQKECC